MSHASEQCTLVPSFCPHFDLCVRKNPQLCNRNIDDHRHEEYETRSKRITLTPSTRARSRTDGAPLHWLLWEQDSRHEHAPDLGHLLLRVLFLLLFFVFFEEAGRESPDRVARATVPVEQGLDLPPPPQRGGVTDLGRLASQEWRGKRRPRCAGSAAPLATGRAASAPSRQLDASQRRSLLVLWHVARLDLHLLTRHLHRRPWALCVSAECRGQLRGNRQPLMTVPSAESACPPPSGGPTAFDHGDR